MLEYNLNISQKDSRHRSEALVSIPDIKAEVRTRKLLSTKPVCCPPCYEVYAKEADSKERKEN